MIHDLEDAGADRKEGIIKIDLEGTECECVTQERCTIRDGEFVDELINAELL